MSFKVKAVYEYVSGHEDDLGFSVGQIITVTDEEDADWYGGEYVDDAGTKHEGIFPRNFVEKYEPTAPPRPSRARPKKEAEPAPAPAPAVEAAAPPPPPPEAPEQEEIPEPAAPVSPTTTSAAPPLPAAAPAPPAPKPVEPAQPPAPVPAPAAPVAQRAEVPLASSPPAPKPAPSVPKASGPPPVSEKPTSSSFKDRIAAFNKAAAPPVAPFKPSGLSSGSTGFIKKPFVAPPPSRNAYVPPPTQAPVAKVYRRDEDPEVREQEAEALDNAGKAGLVPAAPTNEGEAAEDQPKPMSLKERLALLQKQQMETAARHAEAAAKKEKPKRPPKKRLDSQDTVEGEQGERAEETSRTSTDEPHPPRVAHPPRRRSSKGAEPRDGNEADMSGAGETTEGQEDLTEKEESDEKARHATEEPHRDDSDQQEEAEEEDEEEEEEDIDPEVRRKEELRARMARMAGGMGMPGMAMPLFGAPAPVLPKKKKAAAEKRAEETEEPVSPTARAPPVPLPGLMRPPPPPEPKQHQPDEEEEEEDESHLKTPHQESAPPVPSQGAPPPIPGGRPAPPPVPTDSRPPLPPAPASGIKSPSEGSESDDELGESDAPGTEAAQATRAPPPPPPAAAAPPPLPPTSPRISHERRTSYLEDTAASTPRGPAAPSKRNSRPPPPIPSSPPAPPAAQTRPPPPPPSAAPPLRRVSTGDPRPPPPPVPAPHKEDDEEEEEVTEYEGDYDTDIASSVPHKDALKAHQRESSFEDVASPRLPVTEAPPVPLAAPPRAGPPPIPSQPPPETRKSVDAPRAAPPPPPPPKETPRHDEEYDPYNYTAPPQAAPAAPSYAVPTPPPHLRQPQHDDFFSQEPSSYSGSQNPRSPPPPPPGRGLGRQSVDLPRPSVGRRSVDVSRPSMESGFVANDIDLASQSGWWLQPNGLPPQLHGRKDIFFESDESTAADAHHPGKTTITRDIYVLFQDYSQTVITVRFSPQDLPSSSSSSSSSSSVSLEQRHEPPPRALRQDQLEQAYERFGRAIGEAAASKKDSVVGDGSPHALVYDLLRPHRDALLPVGTRAYGALVYSNLANASTTQNDEIRPGDIVSIRNAKFQGKHGAMHAKYSVEVGKPDHVGVVAEWDGTKRKVRAWEQGRESKKVKMESFKLDDLRSGEVKIWRVMPRSWIGWEAGGNGAGGGGAGGSGN